jgi:hypothetical protein
MAVDSLLLAELFARIICFFAVQAAGSGNDEQGAALKTCR